MFFLLFQKSTLSKVDRPSRQCVSWKSPTVQPVRVWGASGVVWRSRVETVAARGHGGAKKRRRLARISRVSTYRKTLYLFCCIRPKYTAGARWRRVEAVFKQHTKRITSEKRLCWFSQLSNFPSRFHSKNANKKWTLLFSFFLQRTKVISIKYGILIFSV